MTKIPPIVSLGAQYNQSTNGIGHPWLPSIKTKSKGPESKRFGRISSEDPIANINLSVGMPHSEQCCLIRQQKMCLQPGCGDGPIHLSGHQASFNQALTI